MLLDLIISEEKVIVVVKKESTVNISYIYITYHENTDIYHEMLKYHQLSFSSTNFTLPLFRGVKYIVVGVIIAMIL